MSDFPKRRLLLVPLRADLRDEDLHVVHDGAIGELLSLDPDLAEGTYVAVDLGRLELCKVEGDKVGLARVDGIVEDDPGA